MIPYRKIQITLRLNCGIFLTIKSDKSTCRLLHEVQCIYMTKIYSMGLRFIVNIKFFQSSHPQHSSASHRSIHCSTQNDEGKYTVVCLCFFMGLNLYTHFCKKNLYHIHIMYHVVLMIPFIYSSGGRYWQWWNSMYNCQPNIWGKY